MEEESGYIHSAYNVSNLIYHSVTPTKYRRLAITETVEACIQQICAGIELRYVHPANMRWDRAAVRLDKIPRSGR